MIDPETNKSMSVHQAANKLLVDNLETKQQIKRLEELLGNRMPVKYALVAIGITEKQARKVLDIPVETDFTSDVALAATVKYLKRLGEKVDSLEHEMHAPSGRVSKLQRGVAVVDKRSNQTAADVKQLKLDFGQLDELLKGNLQSALKAGSTGGEKSFIRTCRAKGLSDDEICKAFSILKQDGDGELDLDNADMYVEHLNEFLSFRETTTETLTEHDTAIKTLRKDVTLIEGSHRELQEDIKTIRKEHSSNHQRDSFPLVGTIISAIIAVVVFFALRKHNWHAGPQTSSTVTTAKGVKVQATNIQNHDIAFAHPWFDGVLAVFVFLALVSFFWMFSGRKSSNKSKTTSSKKSRSGSSVGGAFKKGYNGSIRKVTNRKASRKNGTPLQASATSPDAEKTQVLPVVDAEDSQHQKVS